MPDPIDADTSFDFSESSYHRTLISNSASQLLKQLDEYRVSYPSELEDLESWVYADTDLSIGDSIAVLESIVGTIVI